MFDMPHAFTPNVMPNCCRPLDSPQSRQEREPITEDLSRGATFKFKIASSLPEFTFKVIPEVQPADDYGPHSTVREVQVFWEDAKEPIQTLDDCEFAGMEAPPRGSQWFRAEDMNFDGYKDIFIMTTWGPTGNQFGCVWLYDQQDGRFWYSKEFSELGRFELDAATKTIKHAQRRRNGRNHL